MTLKRARKGILYACLSATLLASPAMAHANVLNDLYEQQRQNDDGDCSNTKQNIDKEAERRLQESKVIADKTMPKARDFLDTMKACLDQLGGAFRNPFGLPGNPFDGLADRLCNEALNIATSQNPVTRAVNGMEISDPTGTFSYNPSVEVNRSGRFETGTAARTNDTAGKVWGEVRKEIPTGSQIWGN